MSAIHAIGYLRAISAANVGEDKDSDKRQRAAILARRQAPRPRDHRLVLRRRHLRDVPVSERWPWIVSMITV
jgi:hypothetical protein